MSDGALDSRVLRRVAVCPTGPADLQCLGFDLDAALRILGALQARGLAVPDPTDTERWVVTVEGLGHLAALAHGTSHRGLDPWDHLRPQEPARRSWTGVQAARRRRPR